MKRTLALCFILVLVLATAGCDGTVKKAAEYMDDAADAIGLIQAITISAEANDLISGEIHDGILKATLKASTAGLEIVKLLTMLDQMGVEEFNVNDKTEILTYLTAMSEALDPVEIIGILDIEDAEVRHSIQTGFETARSVLSAFNIMIQTGE